MMSVSAHLPIAACVTAGFLYACGPGEAPPRAPFAAPPTTGVPAAVSGETAGAAAGAAGRSAAASEDTRPIPAGMSVGTGVAGGSGSPQPPPAGGAATGQPTAPTPATLAGAGGGGSAAAGSAGSAGQGGGAGAPATVAAGSCEGLPPVDDYARPGPFADANMFDNAGPNGNYYLFRPADSLGRDGFKHPIATWGNGIATTPDQYQQTLKLVASHGFVIIACKDTQAERPCLSAGLDWLIAQNAADGPLQDKLDVTREVAIGYSWGGGAAIDTSDRPNIRTTISLHGMPPRQSTAFESMHSPLLLFTSTGDSFVTASGYVTPNYERSKVQTFYATLDDSMAGHLYVVDTDAVSCIVSAALGECRGAEAERAPVIAWLRYWACDDQAAKGFFFGDDCTLCQAPWTKPQRKHWQ